MQNNRFSEELQASRDAIQMALSMVLNHGMSMRQIEREFNISRKTLGLIRNGHIVHKNRKRILTMLILALKRELERSQVSADLERVAAIQRDVCELFFFLHSFDV